MPDKMDLNIVQEICGNLRIDDGDEGPMLELKFHDTFVKIISDDEKREVMDSVVDSLAKIFEKNMPEVDQLCDRRGAIAATRASNAG